MDGLIIKKKWLDLIVSGKKILEIRSSNTGKIGEEIYLLEGGTHRVVARCIIESTHPISNSNWSNEQKYHCVNCSYEDLRKRYKTPYAWVLKDVKPIIGNKYYKHPKGAVIWVKNVELIEGGIL